jgi:hypothetical protein
MSESIHAPHPVKQPTRPDVPANPLTDMPTGLGSFD